MRRGLEEDEFVLFYQPQISLADETPSGVEALLRWNHPQHGLVNPANFIPQAEQSNLIGPLTEYVISQACGDLSELRENGFSPRMSINLSAASIYDLELPEKLYNFFGRHRIEPGHVALELTETAVMADAAASIDILTRLRMKGFHLSIDDFGIGYSSMEQLVRIPFSELKLDQKFVRGLLKYPECRSVTEVTIALAHKLGLTVVAEGIEDDATLDEVRNLGCEEGQGFVIGRPMPLEQITGWLTERNAAAH
ncbi:EAL domain-containing protein [Nisaea acidiphila]|uniref:EAL domain-containing protein n=1 Tax=Nisaea acidiphila TaxID=1862145 RepID=A0A9J7AXX8_9PROT|nr:EAL domain-containing protein [Nisaea acidiphila]UUX52255.1 EAL domain-containing protein [Nisaea acidiphila]